MLVKPYDATGYHLGKFEWLDMVAARYNSTLIDAPAHCDACPNVPYTLTHALTCNKGSNRIYRHDTVKNGLAVIGQKALGQSAFHVKLEPYVVQPGCMNVDSKRMTKGLVGDVYMRGVHPLKQDTIIDVRVLHPDSGQNSQFDSTAALLEHHEVAKRKKYQRDCDAKGKHFVPFVVTTDGAMGPAALKLVDALADRLQKQWQRPKGLVRAWVKMRLSLAVARATSACIRGNRRALRGAQDELEIEIGDGAGIAPLFDLGGMARPGGAKRGEGC
jgi:hypothetical protein